MGWFSHDSDEASAYNSVTNESTHKSEISHQLIAAAASYEVSHTPSVECVETILICSSQAARAYEKHVEAKCVPSSRPSPVPQVLIQLH